MDKTESLSGAKPVFIGKIIEMELRRQERTVTWLSRKIHCDRRNAYNIFSRTSIDTELLYKLSIALNTDFFAYFSASLQHVVNQTSTPPRIRHLHKTNRFFPRKFISHLCEISHHTGGIKNGCNERKFAS